MKTYNFNNYSYVYITEIPFEEIDRIDIAKCSEPSQTIKQFYKNNPADVITNGGMFNMSDGKPVMTLRDEYSTKNVENWLKTGVGIVGDKTLVNSSIDDMGQFRDFISFYPVLIHNGEKADFSVAKSINYRTRRTAIGWNNETLFLICVESPGLLFSALQDIFLDLGATEAGNLDGGGSTCMYVAGERVTEQTYERPVDNVLCVYLNEYLYKVQVGAFSKYENAQKIKKEIESLGYSCFITKLKR